MVFSDRWYRNGTTTVALTTAPEGVIVIYNPGGEQEIRVLLAEEFRRIGGEALTPLVRCLFSLLLLRDVLEKWDRDDCYLPGLWGACLEACRRYIGDQTLYIRLLCAAVHRVGGNEGAEALMNMLKNNLRYHPDPRARLDLRRASAFLVQCCGAARARETWEKAIALRRQRCGSDVDKFETARPGEPVGLGSVH